PTKLDITINGVHIENDNITGIDEAIRYINTYTVPTDSREGTGVKAVKSKDGSGIEFVNDNSNGTTDNMKNIDLTVNNDNEAGEIWTISDWKDDEKKFGQYESKKEKDKTLWTATKTGEQDGTLKVTEGGETNKKVITAHKYIYSSSAQDLPPMYNPDGGNPYVQGTGDTPTWGNTEKDIASKNYYEAVMKGSLLNTDARTFHSTEDLRELLQRDARYGVDYDGSGGFEVDGSDLNEGVKV
ncbi:flagellar hook protein FlgE, partial [Campylobacter sp. MRC_CM1]